MLCSCCGGVVNLSFFNNIYIYILVFYKKKKKWGKGWPGHPRPPLGAAPSFFSFLFLFFSFFF
jgi:hypothetical protein